MAADIAGILPVKAIAAATGASPAPKVFSVAGGLETFSTDFIVEWSDRSGKAHELRITPELNAKFQGPYNRRNIYGAALSYGPALAVNPRMKPVLDAVLARALCGDAPILKELGVETGEIVHPIRVRYVPKQNPQGLPTVLEAPCRH
jgi:hypothetical protein